MREPRKSFDSNSNHENPTLPREKYENYENHII